MKNKIVITIFVTAISLCSNSLKARQIYLKNQTGGRLAVFGWLDINKVYRLYDFSDGFLPKIAEDPARGITLGSPKALATLVVIAPSTSSQTQIMLPLPYAADDTVAYTISAQNGQLKSTPLSIASATGN